MKVLTKSIKNVLLWYSHNKTGPFQDSQPSPVLEDLKEEADSMIFPPMRTSLKSALEKIALRKIFVFVSSPKLRKSKQAESGDVGEGWPEQNTIGHFLIKHRTQAEIPNNSKKPGM